MNTSNRKYKLVLAVLCALAAVQVNGKDNREVADTLIRTVDGGSMDAVRSVGAWSKVSGRDLETYPSMYLYDALSGRLNGLFYQKTSSEPASNSWSGFVRAYNGGTPVIMIDGVVRSLDYIEPETIESVELLKDASLKSLYGGEHTNGILMVTTRRGSLNDNYVRVNVQSGVEMPTVTPSYLNSSRYAEAYNNALGTVGLPALYDPSAYDGSKPYQYPDVDWYDLALKKQMTMTRANVQFSGGSRNTRYFLHVGFQQEKGLQKLTSNPDLDRTLTLRGNVDNTIFDFITFKVGVNAAIQKKEWPNVSASSLISLLSDLRPNEMPASIPGSMVGSPDEWVPAGTSVRQRNPLGDLTKSGYTSREFSYVQSDLNVVFDFDRWVKGFKVTPSFTFDIYNHYSSVKGGTYSVYEPTSFDEEGNVTGYTQWGYDNVVTSQSTGNVKGIRNWHFRTTANYDRTFNSLHKLSAVLMYFMQQQSYNSEIHSVRRINMAAQANYMYDSRYVVDASVNYIGVPSFAPSKRYRPFPTIGAGWIISSEEFMKNASRVDFLKLRASYGILGSTNYSDLGIVSSYYYRSLYSIGSSYGQFTSFNNIVKIAQTGNPDISYQKTYEFNAGVDFAFFGNSLTGSAGIFRNDFTGSIVNSGDITPGVTGKGAALMNENRKAYRAEGFEAELSWHRTFGKLEVNLGGNVTLSHSKTLKELQPDYPDWLSGLRKTTFDGDYKGYRVIGTFKDQEDIDSSPVQAFHGNVYPGDLKYRDTNGDGYITDADKEVIANTVPKMQYGINIGLRCFGFNLDVIGYGLAGFDTILSNKYYQIYGTRKYSDVVVNGLPNGNAHPVLHADSSDNNFVASDWWKADGGFFKIRNVELGYTLPDRLFRKTKIRAVKVYARGSNLFTVSEIKDLDPECIDAGITGYSLMKSITGGLSFSF